MNSLASAGRHNQCVAIAAPRYPYRNPTVGSGGTLTEFADTYGISNPPPRERFTLNLLKQILTLKLSPMIASNDRTCRALNVREDAARAMVQNIREALARRQWATRENVHWPDRAKRGAGETQFK